MKLPRIVADQGIPSQIPGGYAGGEAFGVQTAQMAQEGAAQVGRAGLRASDAFAHASNVLEHAQAKAELDGALTQFKGQMTDADIALKEQGNPDTYATALRSALKERATAISDTLTSALARSAFAGQANALAETKLSAAKYDALHMRNGLTRILEENNQTQDSNAAVHGSTETLELQPDGSYMSQQRAAFKRGIERGPDLLRKGILTPAESAAMTHKFIGSVELGQMYKDASNPEMRPAVISTLLHGGYNYMDPEKQRQIAHTMQAESDRAYKDQQEGLHNWWTEQQALKVADLYRQASAGKLTVEQLNADSVDWKLHRTDIAALQTEMQKPLQEGPSDQATLDRLDVRVHSQQPTATDQEINAERAAGRLNRKDALAYKDHLNSRLEAIKTKGDSIQMQHHNQAEQEARAAFNIPAAADKYEGNQGKVWAAYLRELTARSSAYNQSGEDALKINEEIVPRFKAILGDDARMEVDKIRGLLKFQTWPELKAARDTGTITQGEYVSQAGFMVDLDAAMTRQQAVDDEAKKLAAERLKKDAEKKSGLLPDWLRSPFGAPPANAPNKGRP